MDLRQGLYSRLVRLANEWRSALGGNEPFPAGYSDFLRRCHAVGQRRPTPLLLRYGPGDSNCLHQDRYGVLTEQRPRMQSRVHVVPLEAGEAVIFAVNHRPVRGTRGTYRVTMRHGVSPLRSGSRHTLGIILHDAA